MISAPQTLGDNAEFARAGDAVAGQQVFLAGGCASCHSARKAEGDEKLLLTGGRAFASPFGTFYAPNISSDLEFGIGNWSIRDLANAMIEGVSPTGKHYYPALPYTSYARSSLTDITDLHAYLGALPPSIAASREHELPLPFRFRRGLDLWKLLYLNDYPVVATAPNLRAGNIWSKRSAIAPNATRRVGFSAALIPAAGWQAPPYPTAKAAFQTLHRILMASDIGTFRTSPNTLIAVSPRILTPLAA